MAELKNSDGKRRYWLMKSEPETFSYDDLLKSKNQTTSWNGVRNYQARNFMRDLFKVGDQVIFYHSNANPPSAVGVCEVVKEGYKEEDVWVMVDIKAKKKFKNELPLELLRKESRLKHMELLRKGSRLSIQPVTPDEFKVLLELGSEK